MFALRAFKTALFGTPKPTTTTNHKPISTTTTTTKNDPSEAPVTRRASTPSTKPNGILLTPGTNNGRRKTVSFGEDIADQQAGRTRRSGLPEDCPGKYPSPWSARPNEQSARPTPLTQSLIAARSSATDETAASSKGPSQPIFERARSHPPVPSNNSTAVPFHSRIPQPTTSPPRSSLFDTNADANADADTTLDMDRPRSTSGRYWKSSLESYHTQTEREMHKLVKYKEMAKSYAKKKDAEAIDLQAALCEERAKVAQLEIQLASRPSRLACQQNDESGAHAELQAARTQLAELRTAAAHAESEKQRLAAELARARDELQTRDAESTRRAATTTTTEQQERDREEREEKEKAATEELARVKLECRQTQRELRAAREETSDVRMETVGLRRELREARAEIKRLKRGRGRGLSSRASDARPVVREDDAAPVRPPPTNPVVTRPSLPTTAQIASALGTVAADRALLDLSLNLGGSGYDHEHDRSGVVLDGGGSALCRKSRHAPEDDSLCLTLTVPLDWESTLAMGGRGALRGEKDGYVSVGGEPRYDGGDEETSCLSLSMSKRYRPGWNEHAPRDDSGTYDLPALPVRTSAHNGGFDITAGLNGTDVESTMEVGAGQRGRSKGMGGLTPERREGAKRRLEAKRQACVRNGSRRG